MPNEPAKPRFCSTLPASCQLHSAVTVRRNLSCLRLLVVKFPGENILLLSAFFSPSVIYPAAVTCFQRVAFAPDWRLVQQNSTDTFHISGCLHTSWWKSRDEICFDNKTTTDCLQQHPLVYSPSPHAIFLVEECGAIESCVLNKDLKQDSFKRHVFI